MVAGLFLSNHFSLPFVTGRTKNFDRQEINHKAHKEKKHKEPKGTKPFLRVLRVKNFVISVVKKLPMEKKMKSKKERIAYDGLQNKKSLEPKPSPLSFKSTQILVHTISARLSFAATIVLSKSSLVNALDKNHVSKADGGK